MLKEITIDPKICHGKPCIKGTRIPIEVILELVANGYTFERIIKDCYPHLTKKQIKAALQYSASIIKNEKVYPLPSLKSSSV